ncbi:MAG: FAD-dependent oxidoreductase [Proteobacteria bacterium]|nr:FAD-dependent oxidoreductase [Pseudomonadota bacterium]
MQEAIKIKGIDSMGRRITSKQFEEKVQKAVVSSNNLTLKSYGQHNIGGRLFKAKGPVSINISGPVGQRLGCMAQPGTTIVCDGPASDDVGYLNIGADITVLGDATNGVCNAMAQGRVKIRGSIGSRGLTMTKWNPEYKRPQLWVLGSVGDFFAEFNCGGIGVVCGIEAQTPENVLGYRPCVGMVGGWIYYRGETDGSYSIKDVRQAEPDDEQWQWLMERMPKYLKSVDRLDLLDSLSVREEWKMLISTTPLEKETLLEKPMTMGEFRYKVWDPAYAGADAPRGGDPLRDLAPDLERSPIGLIESGDLRRREPYWANRETVSPCTFYCPVHIPTIDRLRLTRQGRFEEAYQLIMQYTPLPASVCGSICPNLCMENCSRQSIDQRIHMEMLGRALLDVPAPLPAPPTGKKVAIIGGGPSGMGTAWQLALAGIEAHIFEKEDRLGGKLAQVVPWERLPQAVWEKEISRFLSMPNIRAEFNVPMTAEKVEELKKEYEYVVIAVGTHEPRRLQFKGSERVVPGLDFLKSAKSDSPMPVGKKVVVIGAGNAGCDVACEAYRLGAEEVTLVDNQKPLSFGKERAAAEALGAAFRWPVSTGEVTGEGLVDTSGELYPAQTVIISIGDIPVVDFLPDSVECISVAGASWVKTDEAGRTSDEKIFAVGDVEKPGLATDALGSGKKAAEFITAAIKGEEWKPFRENVTLLNTMTLEHYTPERIRGSNQEDEANRCLSCGSCRDCELCEFICPENAISRRDLGDGDFEYAVDGNKCIACGFCVDTCPCGIWLMHTPSD